MKKSTFWGETVAQVNHSEEFIYFGSGGGVVDPLVVGDMHALHSTNQLTDSVSNPSDSYFNPLLR